MMVSAMTRLTQKLRGPFQVISVLSLVIANLVWAAFFWEIEND